MNAYTQLCLSCFKYVEMNTKGGEKEVKEVKITISEPFGAGYMGKNILLVTPLKWESAVREFTTIYLVCALRGLQKTNFIGKELEKTGLVAKALKKSFFAMKRILAFSQRRFYRNKKHF